MPGPISSVFWHGEQAACEATPGSKSSSPAPAGKPRSRYYLASSGGVLPGACAGGLWDASQKERTRSWNKIDSDSSRHAPQPQLHSPSAPDTTTASRSSVMKRGDMEIPCQWERSLVREISAEGERRRAASVDYHALASAQQRSSSGASSTAQEHRGRTSSRRQSAPCNAANRFNLFSGGENLGLRSSSETPADRTFKRRPSDPWAGRCEPISGGISDRQRSTSSRRTESTALYNSPQRTTGRSLPREGLAMESLLWGSSALPVDCPVPALFGETFTPRSYIQPRVGMQARRASLPAKPDSTQFITDPVIRSAAQHHQAAARQEQSESAKAVAEIGNRNPITLAEEPPASTSTSKPYNGLIAPFDAVGQQSPRDVAIPGMSRKLNGAVNHHSPDSAIETHKFSAGVLSAKQPYHPSTRPALYRHDRDDPVMTRKNIDCLRAESMELPSSSRSSVKRPKVRTGMTSSSIKPCATERSPATTTRSSRVQSIGSEARAGERSPATTTRGLNISAKARATERSPAVTTRATRGPTISAEARATERSPATTSRATKGPATATGAEARATERSPSLTSRASRGPSISAEPRDAVSSPATSTRSARGPITPRTSWR